MKNGSPSITELYDTIHENDLEIFISIPRLAILLYLSDGERRRLVEIRKNCKELDMSDRAILHHIGLLVENEFLVKETSGIYRITEKGKKVLSWFRFTEERYPDE